MPVPTLPQREALRRTDAADFAGMMQPTSFEEVGAASRLAATPNEPFFLRHHPGNWRPSRHLSGGRFWLPEITPHVLAPGVNGIRTRDKHETVEDGYRNSVRDGEDNGWHYLSPRMPVPLSCLPPGVPPGGYLRDLACQDPRTRATGRRYLEAWCLPADTVPGEPQRFLFHHPSYEMWLRWLVESGEIGPMPDYVAEMLRQRYANRVARVQMLNIAPDIREARVRAAAELAEAFIDARQLHEPLELEDEGAPVETVTTPPASPPGPVATTPSAAPPPTEPEADAATEAAAPPPRRRRRQPKEDPS